MSFESTRRRVAVVGGGIAGLTAALRLDLLGHDVEVIEAESRLGGRFGLDKLGDRPVMTGGKNIGREYHTFRWFTAELGADAYESFGYNASRIKDGEVLTLDSERRGQTLRNIRRMGSPRDLARLATMAARIRADRRNRFLGSRYFSGVSHRHDHAPLSAFFGPELTQTLVRPMVIRNNGAEPDEVYPGTFGTNLAMLLDHYDQLSDGIQPVLEAFAKRVPVRLDSTVEDLEIRDGRITGLRISERGAEAKSADYDGVVLATPAHATAEIVRSARPGLARRLDDVNYFPSTVVLVEYDRDMFTHDVRALAMDDGPCSNAGSYGQHERHIVRYTYSGREGRLTDLSPENIDRLTGATEELLVRHLGAPRAERVNVLVKHWKAAYSGYLPYHAEFLADVRRSVADVAGLELAGDYIQGVSIEACARTGRAAAGRLATHLGSPGSTA
ncbi:FAD-binding protein [Streptomyces ipomoeae]|uniref:FAD dependent oxidoreductase n=2 Tax=Streptomyces ipomoeae TaxID=103232 RepID=L1KMN6_9ACTN|nr:FAD-dependent oxidoreductase [Streptomyces ipomoeae]EKX62081.1 FAD dependent oxidoreductase [Streptomyces ipomoeae 91-03]MDX2695098.1 FAD-dependent oxidoreductase [Streptomyces ipomoeae]MDX2825959.1 FAD-dependent oxidoreductase [Streptomyces ipomoeae]MDX2844315.1 FAD-dependent oxidoreductase [Streptomyces ipomoeae]MDX2875539.1 FAD-dependent oxidoreductase [Streptomyces ipomoeae]